MSKAPNRKQSTQEPSMAAAPASPTELTQIVVEDAAAAEQSSMMDAQMMPMMESLKSPPVADHLAPTSPVLRVDPIDASYDWKRGHFKESGGFGLWIGIILQFLLSLAAVIGPLVVSELGLIGGGYSLFQKEPPVKPHVVMEILRAVLLVGMGFLAQSLFLMAASLVPYFIHSVASCTTESGEIPRRKQQRIDHFLALRWYAGAAVLAVTAAITSYILYPLPPVVTQAASSDPAAAAAGAKKPHLAASTIQLAMTLAHNSPQFWITRTLTGLAVYILLVFVQKLLLQRLAVYYHTRSLADRIDTNNFAHKATRRLKKHFRSESSAHLHSSSGELQTGELLFRGICPPGQDPQTYKLTAGDLAPFLAPDDAQRYFSILDTETSGDLTQAEFNRAIQGLYRERDALDSAIIDQSRIFARLDGVLGVVMRLLGLLILLAVLEMPLEIIFSTIGATIGALVFIFGSSLEEAFKSIVFIIFAHPFDVDDRVIIDEVEYRVKEVGLWSCTLSGPENRTVYMTNASLSGASIVNLRRSPSQREAHTITILPGTPLSNLQILEEKINRFLAQHPRDYAPMSVMRNFVILDSTHMNVDIGIQHRGNFQDKDVKDLRSRNFVLFLREAIRDSEIELAPPFWDH